MTCIILLKNFLYFFKDLFIIYLFYLFLAALGLSGGMWDLL